MKKDTVVLEEKKKSKKGFRLELFGFFIIFFTVILTFSLLLIVTNSRATYDRYHKATETYFVCQTAANDARKASERVTMLAREFVNDGNMVSLEKYFTECNETKTREKAIETLKAQVHDPSKDVYLDRAVDLSISATETELTAIRLVMEANGTPVPEEIQKRTQLTQMEQQYSSTGKIELANKLLQDSNYNALKTEINRNIEEYLKDLLKDTRETEENSLELFNTYQMIQLVVTFFIVIMLIVTVVLTSIFLIRPLRKSTKQILLHRALPVKGPMEMRTFAALYNKALESSLSKQDKLSHDASHDSLTGIQNRIIFDSMCHSVTQTNDTAIVLLDIDDFKTINDTHGHDIGDGVLKKVAKLLTASFRSDDIVCRIGGDEFTVIMQDVSFYQKEQIAKKMGFLTENLAVATDDLPAATVSVGIAFGDAHCSFNDLYKRADDALYGVKTTTKNAIKVYGA